MLLDINARTIPARGSDQGRQSFKTDMDDDECRCCALRRSSEPLKDAKVSTAALGEVDGPPSRSDLYAFVTLRLSR